MLEGLDGILARIEELKSMVKSMRVSVYGEKKSNRNAPNPAKTDAAGTPQTDFSRMLDDKINKIGNDFSGLIEKYAKENGLDPDLVRAVIKTESNFNPKAVSGKNAKGIMQLIDPTAKEMGVVNPFDPEQNIMGGTKYLRNMINRFDGDLTLGLAAYNAGPGAVEKAKGIPNIRETQNYVYTVMSDYLKLKNKGME